MIRTVKDIGWLSNLGVLMSYDVFGVLTRSNMLKIWSVHQLHVMLGKLTKCKSHLGIEMGYTACHIGIIAGYDVLCDGFQIAIEWMAR